MPKSYALPVKMAIFASSGMGASYAAMTAVGGMPNGVFMLVFINNTSQDVTISLDGTNDAFYVPTMSEQVFDLQTNSSPNNWQCCLQKGTVIYGKGTAGTGNFYISGWYQPNQPDF